MDKNTQKVMFSHKNDEWETPQDFYDKLNEKIGFTLDPCANASNYKCKKYFTIHDDGLKQSWAGYRCFVNPPYSQIKEWAKKCYEESLKEDTIVSLLCPVRSDTSWFYEYCMKAYSIYFIRGRLKFSNEKNCAPFPSMVVNFNSNIYHTEPLIYSWSRK